MPLIDGATGNEHHDAKPQHQPNGVGQCPRLPRASCGGVEHSDTNQGEQSSPPATMADDDF